MRGIKKFDSISSMSGILDITAHPKSWHLPEVFGPYEKKRETWEAHSAYQLAQKHKELLSNTRLLITVSEQDDAAFQDNEKFHDLLVGMGRGPRLPDFARRAYLGILAGATAAPRGFSCRVSG